jgi:two-component sensor histidine kinase
LPGLGTSIVKALAQQLEAEVAFVSDQAGTTLTVISTNSASR